MAIFVWTEYDADPVAKTMTKTQLNLFTEKLKEIVNYRDTRR